MTFELAKSVPVTIRSLGLDERWLQDQISKDPTLLGLGNLEIAAREHSQPRGGRIDFLMRNEEEGIYYEVEIMLGALDESHIIRTIEYWDIERQRRPSLSHRAVIVAETITARFFNVVRLLNRAVPIIAIQLSTFRVGNDVVIHPIKVLDVIEEAVDPDVPEAERASRSDWENASNRGVLAAADSCAAFLKQQEGKEPRVTYNRSHIALGTTGYNYCWFYRRAKLNQCVVEIRFRGDTEGRDTALTSLVDAGVDATARRTDLINFSTTVSDLQQHIDPIGAALKKADLAADTRGLA